jgi:hypothetical protein
MFFYRINDFNYFLEKYNECFVISKLIDYNNEIINNIYDLKEFFPNVSFMD